jgi:hypothetical protein
MFDRGVDPQSSRDNGDGVERRARRPFLTPFVSRLAQDSALRRGKGSASLRQIRSDDLKAFACSRFRRRSGHLNNSAPNSIGDADEVFTVQALAIYMPNI